MARPRSPSLILAAGLVCGLMLAGCAPADAAKGDPKKEQADSKKDRRQPRKAHVRTPGSASAARSSGGSAGTWMTGDTAQLGAEFRDSVADQFSGMSMGRAQAAMAGDGFQCGTGRNGKLDCKKTMEVGDCTLSWSVRLNSSDAQVSGTGGGGFSRSCGE